MCFLTLYIQINKDLLLFNLISVCLSEKDLLMLVRKKYSVLN